MESSKLSSTFDVDPEEFDWVNLESDLYHWTKALRPVQWYPGHFAKTEKELKDQLKLMDVVIEVRDARIPMSTSHPQVEIFMVYCVLESNLIIDISAVFPREIT